MIRSAYIDVKVWGNSYTYLTASNAQLSKNCGWLVLENAQNWTKYVQTKTKNALNKTENVSKAHFTHLHLLTWIFKLLSKTKKNILI